MKDLPIIFSSHAEESIRKRGARREEVEKSIRSTTWTEVKEGRQEAKMDFSFDAEWNKKSFKIKQVNPVFIVEKDTIVVITVYVFYF